MTVLEPLRRAAAALWRESVAFRFDYPVSAVAAAGPRSSLHYYAYSDRLFFDALVVDDQGIPMQRSRHFENYNPAYVAWYGLMHLEQWARGLAPLGRGTFLRQVQWLEDHKVHRPDGSVVWPYTFDWNEGACRLKAPWISAMAQGLAISSLVRAYRLTGDRQLLDVGQRATRVFGLPIDAGGVRTLANGDGSGAIYEEYPGHPSPRVLDGYLFGLLGLYDLWVQTTDERIGQLFNDGMRGLAHALPGWDYKGKWSWYGTHGYLCPPQYNKLNIVLLKALARVSGDEIVARYAEAWTPERLNALSRAEVFAVFLYTKNRTRLKHLLRG